MSNAHSRRPFIFASGLTEEQSRQAYPDEQDVSQLFPLWIDSFEHDEDQNPKGSMFRTATEAAETFGSYSDLAWFETVARARENGLERAFSKGPGGSMPGKQTVHSCGRYKSGAD